MTITKLIDAVSIGGTAQDAPYNPVEHTVTDACIVLSGILTNGNAPGQSIQPVTLFYYSSPVQYASAAEGAAAGMNHALQLQLTPRQNANAVEHAFTETHIVAGNYLYVWLAVPKMNTAATIDVYVNEVP